MNIHSAIDRLLLDVAEGRRRLTNAELKAVLERISRVGFHPTETERVRGRLSGLVWHGQTLKGSDRLPPASVHYLWHVVLRREWPDHTTQAEYIASIRRIITDPASGVFTSKFQGAPGIGIIRESGDLRGQQGFDWVLVQYRLGWGYWMTAFQPELGLRELDEPDWSDIRWLRRPVSGSGH